MLFGHAEQRLAIIEGFGMQQHRAVKPAHKCLQANLARYQSIGPREARIVTASSDTSARAWDAATGRKLAYLEGHGGDIYSAAIMTTASGENRDH
jgi:hypothetical protein